MVVASSPELVEALNRALWIFGRESFLPHGSREDGFAEDQPVFLTDEADFPNGAQNASWSTAPKWEPPPQLPARCLYMFEGNDEAAVAQARALWQERCARRGAHLLAADRARLAQGAASLP